MLEKNRELALKLFGKSVKWQRARHTLIKCGAAVSLPLAAAKGGYTEAQAAGFIALSVNSPERAERRAKRLFKTYDEIKSGM